jgi:hypothetical protein
LENAYYKKSERGLGAFCLALAPFDPILIAKL